MEKKMFKMIYVTKIDKKTKNFLMSEDIAVKLKDEMDNNGIKIFGRK